MSDQTDIIIAGGGLNGPALALALAQNGLAVTIIDARPAPNRAEVGFDGRAYALAIASQRLLQALGVWADLADHAQPMMQIKASDGIAGLGPSPLHLTFDQSEIEEGPMGQMVEDRHLYAALQSAMAANPQITQIHATSVTAQEIQGDRMVVTLSSGQQIRGRVLIGSDGRASGVAVRAGIRRQGWAYDQTALVAAIGHARDHQGIAHQFFMPEGPLAILPMKGGHRSSIVWSLGAEQAAALIPLGDDDFMAALRPRFGDFLGATQLVGGRFSYPLSLTLAENMVAPRLALVGDAAHGVHPIAGQGLNLGLRDVAALAEVLVSAHRRGEDIGAIDVLERYQHWRRFDVTALALGMDTVNRVFSNDNPLLRAARDAGLGLVNAIPALRRGFIRQAAGLSGPLPRLMSGKSL